MIRVEHLYKSFGDVNAVKDVTFNVEKGEVVGLLGPNGAGKTTTMRMINRLIEPTAGLIFIDGKDHRQMQPERLRQSIGYAIQSVGLFPHLTVADNIATVPELLHWEKKRIANRVEELLTGKPPVSFELLTPSIPKA